jgi:hypothetical protein
MNTLFRQVVLATGICELFAEHAVARACERAGVDPRRLCRSNLKAVLPEIEKLVRTFCTDDLEEIMPRLHHLTGVDAADERRR